MRAALAITILTSCAGRVCAQHATVVGAGFVSPIPIPAAPGEILAIYLTGIGNGLIQPVTATSIPLPYSLAGISITMTQAAGGMSTPVPLLAVFPVSTCTTVQTAGCSQFIGITLQIPYELIPNSPFVGRPPSNAQLVVTQGGQTATVELDPEFDSVHILRTGDSVTQPGSSGGNYFFEGPIVTHLDGTIVRQGNLARPGEAVVMYAAGLGPTTPAATTGGKSVTASTTDSIAIGFDYQASPGTLLPPKETPLFAGLTPGFVGLYQVNFVVPAVPASLQPCSPGGPASNLTIILSGFSSRDVVGICVQPPPIP